MGYLRQQINSEQEGFLVLFPKVNGGDKNNLMRSIRSNTSVGNHQRCQHVNVTIL